MSARDRSCARRPPDDAGFTLVELLVALAILALLIAMVPASLRLAGRAIRIGDELDRSAAFAASLSLLERRLAEALPLYEKDADGRVRILFRGTADRLEFISAAANGPQGGGVYHSSLEIAPASGSAARYGLVLRQGLYRSDAAAPDGDGDVRTLFVASSCMRLRYFGRQPTAEPAQWHDLWQQADALPDLVELRLTDGDPSLGPVRSMVVAPRLRPSP